MSIISLIKPIKQKTKWYQRFGVRPEKIKTKQLKNIMSLTKIIWPSPQELFWSLWCSGIRLVLWTYQSLFYWELLFFSGQNPVIGVICFQNPKVGFLTWTWAFISSWDFYICRELVRYSLHDGESHRKSQGVKHKCSPGLAVWRS